MRFVCCFVLWISLCDNTLTEVDWYLMSYKFMLRRSMFGAFRR